MPKILAPLALTLALGLAACGKSDDAANAGFGNDVVLNDEDAIGGGLNDADPVTSNGSLGNDAPNSAAGNGF